MGFWIKDFQVFETEVQIIMDLIGRRRKISVTISSGKYSHGDRSIKLLLMLSDIFAVRHPLHTPHNFLLKTAAVMEENPENPRAVNEGNVEEKNYGEVRVGPEIMITDKEINDLHNNFGDAIFSADEGRINCMTDAAHKHVHPNNLNNATFLEVPWVIFC